MKWFFKGLLFLLFVPAAAGWGAKAHAIIAHIAEGYLSPQAEAALLGRLQVQSLKEVSTWADQIARTPGYEYTRSWHYATVPDASCYDSTLRPKAGDILSALFDQLEVLAAPPDTETEVFALKMLIHLIGDLHQPLHVGNGKDRGGNKTTVHFFGEEVSLHYVWDRAILDTPGDKTKVWAQRLSTDLKPELRKAWQQGSPLEWLEENLRHRAALYEDLPHNSASSVRYYRRHLPVIEQRLLQAGLRLAMLLNQLYG